MPERCSKCGQWLTKKGEKYTCKRCYKGTCQMCRRPNNEQKITLFKNHGRDRIAGICDVCWKRFFDYDCIKFPS